MRIYETENLEDYFMFPWEASNSLRELRDYWQDLRNQVSGRGIAPRTDIPLDLQQRILTDYKAFRRWENEIGFGDRFLGTFQDELAHYSTVLGKNWELFNNWLAKKNKQAKAQGHAVELAPPKPPVITIDKVPTGKIAVSLGSIAAIVGIGVGLYLLWPTIQKRRKK